MWTYELLNISVTNLLCTLYLHAGDTTKGNKTSLVAHFLFSTLAGYSGYLIDMQVVGQIIAENQPHFHGSGESNLCRTLLLWNSINTGNN